MGFFPLDNNSNNFTGTTDPDNIFGNGGDDVLFGDAGNDVIDGGADNDRVSGDGGNDFLSAGFSGKDTLRGGAGDDTLNGGFGDFGDLADGGAGTDLVTLNYSAGFSGGTTPIFVELGPSFFVLAGGAQGISVQNVERINITTSTGDDVVKGGDFADTIQAGEGFDRLTGRGGDDLLNAGVGGFIVSGGLGTDKLVADMSAATTAIVYAVGASVSFVSDAGDGDASSIEVIDFSSGSGNDDLTGGTGNDFLKGNAGSDNLSGGSGNDTLNAGEGTNTVDGNDGNDVVTTGSGNDNVELGTGNDALQSDGGGNNVVKGEAGDDQIFLGLGNDNIDGGGGNDNLSSSGGSDSLTAGTGNDNVGLTIDTFADVASGGGGNDHLSLTALGSLTQAVVTSVNAANRLVAKVDGAVVCTATGFETFNISGGNGADIIRGGSSDDFLRGGPIFSDPATDKDSVFGFGGNDTIRGDQGNDVLNGGDGNDFVKGDGGLDRVTGGAGQDTFEFQRPTDGVDRITDFTAADDQFYFNVGAGYNALPNGEAVNLISGSEPETTAADTGALFLYDTDNGFLFFDSDGDGGTGPIHIATLTGAPIISSADFEAFI